MFNSCQSSVAGRQLPGPVFNLNLIIMQSYRDLDIYKESKKLAIEVHALSLTLPKFELYEEGSQLRRSSKAVTSMIVEGYSRKRFKADYIKYLVYAQSECDETMVHLDFILEPDP